MINPTEEAWKNIKKALDAQDKSAKKIVSVALSPVQKNILYHDILMLLKSGEGPEEITKKIIYYINDFLEEKEKEQTGQQLPKKGVFRRVEE